MATKFIMPETFSYGKKGALKPNSIKEYTRLLNKLAEVGITSPDVIRAPPKFGVHPSGLKRTANAIYDLSPGTDTKAKALRRAYISAVHWVLPKIYRTGEDALYQLYQRSLPSVDNTTDLPWLPYDEYQKKFLSLLPR